MDIWNIIAVLNYIFVLIAGWGVYSRETVEHTKTVDEMITSTVGLSIKNILIIFGINGQINLLMN